MAVTHRSECLTVVCCRLLNVGLIFVQVEHHHILRCQFARDLTNILRVGGLGVEDRHKSLDLSYLRNFFLCDLPNEEVCLSKPRPLYGLNSIFEIL